jgi:hypothetical protein
MADENSLNYPWYRIVEGNNQILQGHILHNLPLAYPTSKILDSNNNPGTKEETPYVISNGNCIVMTHSCDFQEETPDSMQVVVCPFFDVAKKPEAVGPYINPDAWKSHVKGHRVDYYLLNEFVCQENPELSFPFRLIELKTTYTIPYGVLKILATRQGQRVCLQSPYLEHMSQAFARRFMRVGLPIVIPEVRPY